MRYDVSITVRGQLAAYHVECFLTNATVRCMAPAFRQRKADFSTATARYEIVGQTECLLSVLIPNLEVIERNGALIGISTYQSQE